MTKWQIIVGSASCKLAIRCQVFHTVQHISGQRIKGDLHYSLGNSDTSEPVNSVLVEGVSDATEIDSGCMRSLNKNKMTSTVKTTF